MKRCYSLFVVIGLIVSLMFIQNPGFARSDQDIGLSMEMVSPSQGDVQASITPTTVTAAADQPSVDHGQKLYGLVNGFELGYRRPEAMKHLHSYVAKRPNSILVNLSLPPPPVTLRE